MQINSTSEGQSVLPVALIPAPAGGRVTWWQGTISAAFFASGASGLILELLWTRQFALVFGTTEAALSAVLAAYMAGLALGSYVFGRWSRARFQPLLLYAALEASIALLALGLGTVIARADVVLFGLHSLLGHESFPFTASRFLLAFSIVLVPTTLMGGTLPVLCEAWRANGEKPERPVGILYAANLIGAVAGAGTAGFLLIPAWGVRNATLFAVLLNLAAAVLALVVVVKAGGTFQNTLSRIRGPDPPPVRGSARRTVVLATAGISGFAALIEEVIWSRSLRLVMGSSVYALTLMLVAFLLGLGLGSYLVVRYSDRIRTPVRTLARVQGMIVISLLLAMFLYPYLPRLFLSGFSLLGADTGVFILQAMLAALLLLPSATLLGALFPLAARVLVSPEGFGLQVGRLYAIQTLGNVLGASVAMLWISGFGLRRGLLAAGVLHLTAAVALWLVAEVHLRLRLIAAGATAAAVLFVPVLGAEWQPLVITSGVYQSTAALGKFFESPQEFFRALQGFRLLFYKEGANATVSVYERPTLAPRRHLALAIDGKVDASTGADMSTQVLSAHLPLLLLPQAKDICVVGWASGVTVGSVLLHPVRKVTAIEIEPAVLTASLLFDEFNHRPRADGRLETVIQDARNSLLLSPRKYDVIISEPSNPWLSGPAKLFTAEFFRLAKERLQPEGMFVQWIQIYGLDRYLLRSVVRTFYSVFPFVLVFQTGEGDLLLLGRLSPYQINLETIGAHLASRPIKKDLLRVGVRDSIDLLTHFRIGWEEIGSLAETGELNTDDNGLIEFGAPRSLYRDTVQDNRQLLRSTFRGLRPYLLSPDHLVAARVAQRAIRQGQWDLAEMFAQELETASAGADHAWVLGEIAWRQNNQLTAIRHWQQGRALDPAHFGCLMSQVLALQQLGRFRESEQLLLQLSSSLPSDPLGALVHGINRLATGDLIAAQGFFTAAQSAPSRHSVVSSDAREALKGRLLPLPLLSAFYSWEVAIKRDNLTLARQFEAEATALLGQWRAALLETPSVESRSGLLEAVNLISRRSQVIDADRRLLHWVSEQVLQPLSHYDRAIALMLAGEVQQADAEFARTAAFVRDPEGQSRMMGTRRKLELQQGIKRQGNP